MASVVPWFAMCSLDPDVLAEAIATEPSLVADDESAAAARDGGSAGGHEASSSPRCWTSIATVTASCRSTMT